ncbi:MULTISPECIES: nucleoid-associated protein [unclassified Vibrio]|uniref:nucleoid-associated protein n=3 Tax=Vibrio TaxID=662 RepID=UPI000B8E7699|nr:MULTISPECIES: nucleoid-associated protein [unclassified Vibrio]NAW98619.1 hypothetical protein [Vibrio sp. V23_P3S9T160]OXX29943.1 hypothetical protein B9J81_17050 [Vibrio sp. V04_P4A5T148]OXX32428.1 hypothetical protein B9J95_07195 [Vibrio sp. V14_P6S14T42]
MAAPQRPLVINESMRDSIEIHNFIYHILLKEAEEVDYLSEVVLTNSQKYFFRDMIAEASRGTKYDFIDREHGDVALNCQSILDNRSNDNFVECSEKLAHAFKAQHDKRMANGIVVVTCFSMVVNTERKRFIALLKLDYQSVLRQIRDPNNPKKVSFQEITESLIEDKSAIQKRAVIDVGSSFNWDVIAVEQGKSSSKQDTDDALGTHFKNFLNIKLKESSSALTRSVISHSKTWASKQEGLSPSDVKARVINYLEANDDLIVTVDDIRDIVCVSDSEQDTNTLKASFNSYMDEVNLSGTSFTSKSQSIPKSEKKNKLQTNKHVTITWEGDMDKAGIKKEQVGDTVRIVITANKVDAIY